jgi:glycosyltransferase involved in cell wall biosynthesis
MHQITALLPVKDAAIYAKAIMNDLRVNLSSQDEAIVIDDNSTDDTYEVFCNLIGSDSRFKIIRNLNPGLANALNLGIAEASYNWIARFDSDDCYESNRISEQRELLTDDISCVFTDYTLHDENFNLLTQLPSAIFDPCIKLSLAKNIRTPHPSVIFSKPKALLAGGYRSSEFPAEDLGLWLRMSEHGRFISIPKNLLHYTVRSTSISSVKQAEMVNAREYLIRNSNVLSESFRDVESNWRKYFQHYKSFNQSVERKILTLNEYRLTGRILDLSYKKTLLKMVVRVFIEMKWVFPILKLITGKKRLDRARTTLKVS